MHAAFVLPPALLTHTRALPAARPCARPAYRFTAPFAAAAPPSPGTRAVEQPVPSLGVLPDIVNAVFTFKPVLSVARRVAMRTMVERGAKIGVDWARNVARLRSLPIQSEYDRLRDPSLVLPSYYEVSFHAYDKGNLNWEAALESISASRSVHSTLFTSLSEPVYDGDDRFRANFGKILSARIAATSARTPTDILDLGCSSGISTVLLKDLFPSARVTGIDASPFFLAVASAYYSGTQGYDIKWKHALAEDTKMADGSVDLVTISLVCHELPRSATGKILDEAFRVLRPGGTLAIMEMDPTAEGVERLTANPLFIGLLKSTEPYLDDYFSLNMHAAIKEAGFKDLHVESNSPRHRSMIAHK